MNLSYEAQAKQHAHAVHMRLMGGKQRERQAPVKEAPQMHEDAPHGPYDVGSWEWACDRYGKAPLVQKHGIWAPKLKAVRKVVLDMTVDKFGVDATTLLSDCRFVHVVKARNYCAWMLRMQLRMSLGEIAAFFDKDHSSIIHSIRSHARRVVIMRGQS